MCKPVAKDAFEQLGVDLQNNARTFSEAKEQLEECCTMCTLRRDPRDCKACPIHEAFLANCTGWHRLRQADYLYIEMERRSVDD